MKTARYYILAAMLLYIMSGCVQEALIDTSVLDQYEIIATIATDGPETRTILMDNPGIRVQTRWAADDAIGIFGADGNKRTLTVSAENIGEGGKTAIFKSADALPAGSMTAIYPADANASVSGGRITTVFPDKQLYSRFKGVPQPDPAVSLMAGTGSALTGVAFCNVMAVLKIGQAFDQETTIKAVTFRDLSGKAVAGTISIDPANNFSSEVSGGQNLLTLDCGDGLTLQSGVTGVFYLIVPAREYPRGVEVTFITAEGEEMSRTAGTSRGMTLGRGVIYPLGDIASRDYVAGNDAAVLSDKAHLMTPDVLRQISVLSVGEESVRNAEGGYVSYSVIYNNATDYTQVRAPYYSMLVPRDLNFHEGDYLVFEATDDLPSGGIFQITREETPYADDNHSRIEIHITTDFAKAFKSLDYGKEIFDADGNIIEDSGEDMDLSSYLSEIRDAEGNSLQFSLSDRGEIQLSGDVFEEALTKGFSKTDKTISTDKLSITITDPTKVCEATVSAKVSINMKAGIKIEDEELQFVHFMFNPQIKLSANFAIKGQVNKSESFHLITLYFVPGIPIAPGVVLTPELEIRGSIGIGGEIVFSTSVDYTYDMGRYGFSYLNGQGFTFHHFESSPAPTAIQPEFGAGLSGTVYAQGTITAIPSLSLFRVFRAGIYVDFSLKFGMTKAKETIDNLIYDTRKLFLVPEIAFSPYVASLGGLYTSKWENLIPKIEFEPLWERYLDPVIDNHTGFNMIAPGVAQSNYRYYDGTNYYLIQCQEGLMFPSLGLWGHGIARYIDGFHFYCKSLKPTLDDWEVYMIVKSGAYEGRWHDLCLRQYGIIPSYPYTYTNLFEMNRYKLMDIPENQDEGDDISASGEVSCPGDFFDGGVRSLHMVCVNKSNGRVITVRELGPITYYWPNTPEGPWFTVETVSEYRYNNELGNYQIWPSDIPLP